jgi:hypothetical protein
MGFSSPIETTAARENLRRRRVFLFSDPGERLIDEIVN